MKEEHTMTKVTGAFYKMHTQTCTQILICSCEGKLLKERCHRKLNKEEKRISEYKSEEIA